MVKYEMYESIDNIFCDDFRKVKNVRYEVRNYT